MKMRREFSWAGGGGGSSSPPIHLQDHERYATRSESLVLVMLVEAASADGASRDWWVSQLASHEHMTATDPPFFFLRIATLDQGWTNKEIYALWLSHIFIPFVQPSQQEQHSHSVNHQQSHIAQNP